MDSSSADSFFSAAVCWLRFCSLSLKCGCLGLLSGLFASQLVMGSQWK